MVLVLLLIILLTATIQIMIIMLIMVVFIMTMKLALREAAVRGLLPHGAISCRKRRARRTASRHCFLRRTTNSSIPSLTRVPQR